MRYFVSDCHVMDGGRYDEFNVKWRYFVSLLDKIKEDKRPGENQELILLGDIIDLLETPSKVRKQAESYDEVALDQLENGVFPAHPEVFEALTRFLEDDNSVFYVWGNHDYPLRFGNVNEALGQRILSKTRERSDYGKFTVADYYLSHKMHIYAEHGHRLDPFNLHRNGAPPLGAMLVTDLISKWENRRYPGKIEDVFGENAREEVVKDFGVDCGNGEIMPFLLLRSIRPRSRVFDYIDRLIRYGVLPFGEQEEMLKDLIDILERSGHPVRAKLIDLTSVHGLKNMRNKLLRLGVEDETPRILRKWARESYREVPQLRDLDFVPHVSIMGHSHFLDAREWDEEEKFISRLESYTLDPEKKYYFNLGSWVYLNLVDEDGLSGEHFKTCPYLRLKQENDGKTTADFKDASTPEHKIIDLGAHRKHYIKFGSFYESRSAIRKSL